MIALLADEDFNGPLLRALRRRAPLVDLVRVALFSDHDEWVGRVVFFPFR